MIIKFMDENGMFYIDLLCPTREEMERTIENITQNQEITIDDQIVLWKMLLIKTIINMEK